MAGWLSEQAVAVSLPAVGRLSNVGSRSRRLGLAVVSECVGKVVNLAVQVVQVPLIVAAVGTDLYGDAVATLAFLGLLGGCDFGFGAAVKNAAADLVGRREAVASNHGLTKELPVNDWPVKDLLVKAAAWSALIAVVVGGVIVFAPDALAILPGSDSILPMLGRDAATRWLMVVLVVVGLPLAAAAHCAEGMQLTWLVNACRMVAAVLGLGAIVALTGVVSQRWHVVALLGLTPLVAGVLTWFVLWRSLPYRSCVGDRAVPLARLVHDGLPFMLPIVASLLVVNAPHLAILAADGSPAVTRYAVGQRMMALFLQPLMFAVGPLWPAFAEARARGDRDWVARQAWRISIVGAVYCGVVTVVGIVCGRWVAALWVGRPDAVPTTVEMAAIAVAAGVSAVVQPGAMLLNAYRRFRLATTVAVFQIALTFAYEPLAQSAGPAAVPAAQALFGLLIVVPAVIVESRAALRQ
jgi:O-antigen/teichoic acid export membrane protein